MTATAHGPDPQRVGGLAWTRRTRGSLTAAERRALLGAMARGQAQNLVGRLKLALGRVPEATRGLTLDGLAPPDSRFARDVEAACAEQSPGIAAHSHRTWLYGRALAGLDRAAVDPELFYGACLLHDAGLLAPVAGEDFTLRSSRRAGDCARRAALPAAAVTQLEDGITAHTTPGVDAARDGTLGAYVQAGAMVDLAGFRAWDLPPALIANVLDRHPRDGFTREIIALFRAEAAAVPDGRFAFVARWGFLLAMRMAPFAQR